MADSNPSSLTGEPVRRRDMSLPLAKPFDGTAEQLPKWKIRFHRYHLCSGLSHRSQSEQVSTLLYAMGDVADDILSILRIDETTTSYTELIDLMDGYLNARKNIIFARAKFNKGSYQGTDIVCLGISDNIT